MGVKYSNYYVRTVKEATLKIADVEKMVLDGILLVDPRLVTVEGRRCMFMRPARFFPSKMKTSDVINLLHYMTMRLTEGIRTQFTGFTFVADLGDWKMANFSQGYAFSWFLTMLVMPVRMENFIIIDAPAWFGSIWTVIKQAMTPDFRAKWKYVTRDTIDTVLAKEHRFADIADGTLDINLEQWCEDRRVAEQDPQNVFRHAAEPLHIHETAASSLSDRQLGKSPSRRRKLSSKASSVSSSPRSSAASPLGSGHTTPKRKHSNATSSLLDDDSALNEAVEEMETMGVDNARFSTIRGMRFHISGESEDEATSMRDKSISVVSAEMSIREALNQLSTLAKQGDAAQNVPNTIASVSKYLESALASLQHSSSARMLSARSPTDVSDLENESETSHSERSESPPKD